MTGITLLLIGVAVLVIGYIFYGRWLCKQWGVGESTEPLPLTLCVTTSTMSPHPLLF